MPYKDPLKQREIQHQLYLNKREYYLERNSQRRKENKEFIKKLKDKPCMDCGLTFPYYIMDFDHREGEKKEKGVSELMNFSLKRLLKEIEKCDLVCANCHRARTWTRRQHWN